MGKRNGREWKVVGGRINRGANESVDSAVVEKTCVFPAMPSLLVLTAFVFSVYLFIYFYS